MREGESELKARKPCVGKRRKNARTMNEKRNEKIIENEEQEGRKGETDKWIDKKDREKEREREGRDSAK